MHAHLRLAFAAFCMLAIGLWSLLSPRHKLWPYFPSQIYRLLGLVCLFAAGFFTYVFLIR